MILEADRLPSLCHVLKKGPDYLAFFCIVFSATLLCACSFEDKNNNLFFHIDGPTMGTTYSIKGFLPQDYSINQNSLGVEVEKALKGFNSVMSTYLETSELSKLNRAPKNEWLDVSRDLEKVIQISSLVYAKSKGAFDVTVGPLVNLWGFGPTDVEILPSQEQLDEVRARVGFDKIEIAEGKLKKTKDVYIDLSAVAKGYATDVVADILEANGITNYMVEIGGELRLRGVNRQGKAWIIGIEKPTLGREGAMMGVSGENIAIATSGEYRNYYEKNGIRVSHTVDPATGRPITHNLASVTVIADSGGYADAWATAINVLGVERGLALATEMDMAAFFIIRAGDGFDVKYTQAFEQYMVEL